MAARSRRKRVLFGDQARLIFVKSHDQSTPIAAKQAPLVATNQGQFAFDKAFIWHANPAGKMHEKTSDLGDREAISQGILIARLVHPCLILMCLSACTSVTRIFSTFVDALVGALARALVLRFLFFASVDVGDDEVDDANDADDGGDADDADNAGDAD